MQRPPNDIIKLDNIVLMYIFKLDSDKYFNPCVNSIKPYINLKLLFIFNTLSNKPVIIKQNVIIPSINSNVFAVFMIADIVISCMAGVRQDERHKNIPPKNDVDVFLDNNYYSLV